MIQEPTDEPVEKSVETTESLSGILTQLLRIVNYVFFGIFCVDMDVMLFLMITFVCIFTLQLLRGLILHLRV